MIRYYFFLIDLDGCDFTNFPGRLFSIDFAPVASWKSFSRIEFSMWLHEIFFDSNMAPAFLLSCRQRNKKKWTANAQFFSDFLSWQRNKFLTKILTDFVSFTVIFFKKSQKSTISKLFVWLSSNFFVWQHTARALPQKGTP